jgi:phosphopantetheine adenylyltransferase
MSESCIHTRIPISGISDPISPYTLVNCERSRQGLPSLDIYTIRCLNEMPLGLGKMSSTNFRALMAAAASEKSSQKGM